MYVFHNLAGFTFSPAENAIITLLLILFIVFVLSPALLVFVLAWRYRKHSSSDRKWYQKPTILVTVGVLYVIAIPVFVRGSDVKSALQSADRYEGPIYAVDLANHEIKKVSMDPGADGPGEDIRFYYSSPAGHYSIVQQDYIHFLNDEILKPCTVDSRCIVLAETTLGKVYYYDDQEFPYGLIKTKHGVIKIEQYGDAKDRSPEFHTSVANSLKPMGDTNLLKAIVMHISER